MGPIHAMTGRERKEMESVSAGDIAAVVKLKNTSTGDTLCAKNAPIVFAGIEFPKPVLSVAVRAKAKADEEKINSGPRQAPRGGPDVHRGLRSRHQADHRVGTRRPPHRRDDGEAQGQVRGRGGDREAEDRLPRDAQGRRPRPRASTRSRAADGGSSASRGSRWRRASAGRVSSSSTRSSADRSRRSSSRRSRRASSSGCRRASSPGTRWWTSASRCTTARCTPSIRPRWRSRWPARSVSGTRRPRRSRCSSSPSTSSRSRCPTSSWAT